MRIKNLKYDPNWADKPKRGYSHLEYLDSVFTVAEARRIQDWELHKHGRTMTLEVLPAGREVPVMKEYESEEAFLREGAKEKKKGKKV